MVKTIKNSTVTREQYDKLQVDVVNRIEELEQTVDRLEEAVSGVNRSHRSLEQTVERLALANNNRHLEIRLLGIIAIVLWVVTSIAIGFATGLN
jgi:tetrahydromethanopterin S-methyltransferase subunit B